MSEKAAWTTTRPASHRISLHHLLFFLLFGSEVPHNSSHRDTNYITRTTALRVVNYCVPSTMGEASVTSSIRLRKWSPQLVVVDLTTTIIIVIQTTSEISKPPVVQPPDPPPAKSPRPPPDSLAPAPPCTTPPPFGPNDAFILQLVIPLPLVQISCRNKPCGSLRSEKLRSNFCLN